MEEPPPEDREELPRKPQEDNDNNDKKDDNKSDHKSLLDSALEAKNAVQTEHNPFEKIVTAVKNELF